jgi:hypothetical protein
MMASTATLTATHIERGMASFVFSSTTTNASVQEYFKPGETPP